MIHVGRYNTLPVVRVTARGVRLGTEMQNVFLPASQVPEGTAGGDRMRVFVYTDSEDIPVATTRIPHAVVGEFAFLEVVDVTEHGAFLDWGLPKDLFAPFGRQHQPLGVGDWVVVAISLHTRTNRVIGSSTLVGHFDDDVADLSVGEEVDLLVYGFNDLGAQVVVNGRHAGLIFQDGIFKKLRVGDQIKGFVAQVREDHRLDIVLQRPGKAGTDDTQKLILAALDAGDGYLALHDKSPPEAIQRGLGVSKKAFKKAVGALYKARLIELTGDGIRRLD